MRHILIIFISLPIFSLSQVGIKTDDPLTNLDINGNLRVQSIPDGNKNADKIYTIDKDGFTKVTSKENIRQNKAKRFEKDPAYDVVIKENVNVINEKFSPTLDLWSDQELYGAESIKSVYFLGLSHRVTLPENITEPDDGKIRKITFILIKNNPQGGFNTESHSEGYDQWNLFFQTKKFELESNYGDGCYNDDKSYLYKSNTYSSELFVPDPAYSYQAIDDNPLRARIKMKYEAQIRDRAIVFFDFGGKWIMSVRD